MPLQDDTKVQIQKRLRRVAGMTRGELLAEVRASLGRFLKQRRG